MSQDLRKQQAADAALRYVTPGTIIGVGNTELKFTDNFSLGGIALGTIVAIGAYHLARAVAPKDYLTGHADGTAISVGGPTYGDSDGVDDLYQEGYPGTDGGKG